MFRSSIPRALAANARLARTTTTTPSASARTLTTLPRRAFATPLHSKATTTTIPSASAATTTTTTPSAAVASGITQLRHAQLTQARFYSAPAGLTRDEVQGRIIDVLKGFDKVSDPSKLSENAHFSNDLGLDSLDTVEVVIAIEEEFSIEIPDKDADNIHSVKQAVDYILTQPDAH